MDTVASLYERNSLLHIIERTAREVFIPICVGGGLRTLDDIKSVLRAGADKVAINTAALANPDLIQRASKRFGSSTIVVSLEVIRQLDGSYECFTDNGREATGVDALQWVERVVELGAGELLVTSVDREGTGRGFDLNVIERIASSVGIPVIAGGGAGKIDHMKEVILESGADAVCIASILHYDAIKTIDFRPDQFGEEGNVEFRQRGDQSRRIVAISLPEMKEQLEREGIRVRPLQ